MADNSQRHRVQQFLSLNEHQTGVLKLLRKYGLNSFFEETVDSDKQKQQIARNDLSMVDDKDAVALQYSTH